MSLRHRGYLKESKYQVGFSWDAPGGKREITGTMPGGKFLVTFSGKSRTSMAQQIFDPEDIDFEIRRDAARLKSKEDHRKKAADKEQVRKKLEDTHGFLDRFSPVRAKKALDALMMIVRFNGKLMSRKVYVEGKVRGGAIIGEWRGKRTLKDPGGSFMAEKDLTKTAMDYAGYLIGKGWRG